MKLMFTCNDATLLSDINQYRNLSISEKMKLFSHLMMCKKCTRYHKQNALITVALEKLIKESSKDKLRAEIKTKINQEIDEVLNK